MKLELLENNPKEKSNKKPFLFIHGMWHGAWCYEENFFPYLANKGRKAFALSFSNHGNSDRRKSFNLLTIKQYVKDVEEAVKQIGQEPILVGHSMGGFVIQKYLEKHQNKTNIIMASVPPYGIWAATFRVIKAYPFTFLKANLTLNLKQIIKNKKCFRDLMFSDTKSFEKLENYYNKLDNESFGAYLGMLGFNLVKTKKIKSKIIVVGGDIDNSLVVEDLQKTAKIYNTEPVIFQGVSHDLMLDDKWEEVITKIVKLSD